MKHAIQVFWCALVVGAVPGAASADYFWASCAAPQNNPTPQNHFHMFFGFAGANEIDPQSGRDANTNSFTNPTSQIFGGLPPTVVDFFSSTGGVITQGHTGFFAAYGNSAISPDFYDAIWLQSGDHVPIVPFFIQATQVVVQVTIQNNGGSSIMINSSSYDPDPPQPPPPVPPIPMPNSLIEIPEFIGVLNPGESRTVFLPLPSTPRLYGFYASAAFVSSPNETAITWDGQTVPGPSALALAMIAGLAAGRRRRLG
jgi:hypothetical protein